jgi:hypothetical protein
MDAFAKCVSSSAPLRYQYTVRYSYHEDISSCTFEEIFKEGDDDIKAITISNVISGAY